MSMTQTDDVPACSEAGSRLVTRECRFRSSKRGERARKHPERPENPDKARSKVHTITVDGQTYRRFQKVEETVQNPLADGETTVWTICGFPVNSGDTNEMTVLLKDPPAWSRSKRVPVSQLVPQQYTPVTLDDGQPKWGY